MGTPDPTQANQRQSLVTASQKQKLRLSVELAAKLYFLAAAASRYKQSLSAIEGMPLNSRSVSACQTKE